MKPFARNNLSAAALRMGRRFPPLFAPSPSDAVFDLTSEQFDHPLEYTRDFPQSRETHFSKEEKKARYEILKAALLRLRPGQHSQEDGNTPPRLTTLCYIEKDGCWLIMHRTKKEHGETRIAAFTTC